MLGEIKAAWLALDSTDQSLVESFQSVELSQGDEHRLESVRQLLDEIAQTLFVEPLDRFEKSRPLQRLIGALDQYQNAVDETVRQLPATVLVSPAEISRTLAAGGHRT